MLVKEQQCRDHLVTLNCLAVFLRLAALSPYWLVLIIHCSVLHCKDLHLLFRVVGVAVSDVILVGVVVNR